MNIKEIALRIAEKDERIAELETYLKSETKDKESAQESFGTVWSKWQRCEKRIAQLEKQRDELLAATEAIAINSEECLDFDECTAMLVSIDDYHKLMEAVARAKGEQ